MSQYTNKRPTVKVRSPLEQLQSLAHQQLDTIAVLLELYLSEVARRRQAEERLSAFTSDPPLDIGVK